MLSKFWLSDRRAELNIQIPVNPRHVEMLLDEYERLQAKVETYDAVNRLLRECADTSKLAARMGK